jgi:hypothetical protein
MHGIKEINFQNRNEEAQRVLANRPVKAIDKDWHVRQGALDAYLKAKYGNK